MTDIAIRVEHLSKLYTIGRAQQRHDTLRDALVSTFQRSNVPTFKRLKILSRITEPTSGRAETCPEQRRRIHGRVGSLLEVGTGSQSDPELILRLGSGPARTSASRERRDASRGHAADRDRAQIRRDLC